MRSNRYNPRVSEAWSRNSTEGWSPGKVIRGHVRPPASKSLAIRAFLAASLARGKTRIECRSDAEDVRAARELVAALVHVRSAGPDGAQVLGEPPGFYSGWRAPQSGLHVGESGTLARLATAAFAFCGAVGQSAEIHASGTLLSRSSPAFLHALERAGVAVRLRHDDSGRRGWPLAVTAVEPPEAVVLEHPGSSQEASGLALGLAAWQGSRRLRIVGDLPSRRYFELTLGVLAAFGARIGREGAPGDETFHIVGPLDAPTGALVIESDASAAAVAMAAACLSGGEVTIADLGGGSPQGDVRIVEYLRAFGCEAAASSSRLSAGGAPTRGADLDLALEPDLAPVLAAVAGVVALRGQGSSRLTGLGTLDGKESPRLRVLAEALRAVGCEVATGDDWLTVAPGARTRGPLVLDPRGDHRMAFAFALLGLEREDLRASNPGCVAKSWPGFWRDLA